MQGDETVPAKGITIFLCLSFWNMWNKLYIFRVRMAFHNVTIDVRV